ncbi:MAG: acetyl-CoA hydrolase/transferase C-terminal domain-containing protein [Anaerolineae bacterium]
MFRVPKRWRDDYAQRKCTPQEAVRAIQSGDRVFVTGNCSVPQTLVQALCERAPELRDVEIVQVLSFGGAPYVAPGMEDHIRVNTLFVAENTRAAVNDGRADFTPAFLSDIPKLWRTELPIDVALIHVSPPDKHGFCSYGVEVGVTKTAAETANIVIAEINPNMPRTHGDSFIHVSNIDHLVEVDYPLPEVHPHPPSEVQDSIGRHVAGLIEDGSTLQMGIGGIPDSVLRYLGDRRDLGIHTELFSDGVIELILNGVINGKAKTLHPGKVIAGFVFGTHKLYEFIDDNPIFELHPTEYVNDPFRIAQNDKMVAINSALEVDLTGQVCADSIGHKIYSGVGGQVDFIRGAARSRGGKPIIALPSTAKSDTLSRIVISLKPGSGVVTTRNDVHYVATEFGVAYLHGKSIRERATQLIAIAHPNFREELSRQARELRLLPQQYQGVAVHS